MIDSTNLKNNNNSNLISIKLEKPDLTNSKQDFSCNKLTKKSLVTKDYLYSKYEDKRLTGILTSDIDSFIYDTFDFFEKNKVVEYNKDNQARYFIERYETALKINRINIFLQSLDKEIINWDCVTSFYRNIDNEGNYLYVYYDKKYDFLKTIPDGFLRSQDVYYPVKVFFSRNKDTYKSLEYIIENKYSNSKNEEFSKEELIKCENKFARVILHSYLMRSIIGIDSVLILVYFVFDNKSFVKPFFTSIFDDYPLGNSLMRSIYKYQDLVYEYKTKNISLENLKLNLENLIDNEVKKNLDFSKK